MKTQRKSGSVRRQRKDGSFKAVDNFGRTHQIEIFREMLAEGAEGPQTLVTPDGEGVDRITKGRYRIVYGGIDLTSDDPAAP